jgi:peptidylprolyl isomerase
MAFRTFSRPLRCGRLLSTGGRPRPRRKRDNPLLTRIEESKRQALEGEVEGHSTTGSLIITLGMVGVTGWYGWYLYGAGLMDSVLEFAAGEGAANHPEDPMHAEVGTRVWMEIQIGRAAPERIVIGLFDRALPKTSFNFATLAKRSRADLGYVGTPFHRIIPNFMIQGGDTTRGDGRGGKSVFASEPKFGDEALTLKHTAAGVLSMANSGVDTNGSQFFITLRETPWLDGKHVVFGRVVEGLEVLEKIADVGAADGTPSASVSIAACGILLSGPGADAAKEEGKRRG